MNILSDDNDKVIAIIFANRAEARAIADIANSIVEGKPVNKRSNAYKLLKQIADKLPVY